MEKTAFYTVLSDTAFLLDRNAIFVEFPSCLFFGYPRCEKNSSYKDFLRMRDKVLHSDSSKFNDEEDQTNYLILRGLWN